MIPKTPYEVSLPQTARELKVSYSEAWNMVVRGELDAVNYRGKWFVTNESIARVRREREASAPSAA